MRTRYQVLPPKHVRAVAGCFFGLIILILFLVLLQASSYAGAQGLPDLVAVNLKSPPIVTEGEVSVIDFIWGNYGDATLYKVPFWIRYYLDDTLIWSYHMTNYILEAGTCCVLLSRDIRIPEGSVGVHVFRAVLDADNEIDESDETNNEKANPISIWSSNVQVNDDGTAVQESPVIAADRASNVYAVWVDHRNDPAYCDTVPCGDVYFSSRMAGSNDWSANTKVNDLSAEEIAGPDLVVDDSGVLYAVWAQHAGTDFGIFFSKSEDGGLNWSPSLKINDDSSFAYQGSPDIEVDETGNVYAVWVDRRNGNADIYFSGSNDGGTTWNSNIRLNDDASDTEQISPAITVGESGMVYVVWADFRNSVPHIYLTSSVDGGISWSANMLISKGERAIHESWPAIAIDNDDCVSVGWISSRDVISGNIYVVRSCDGRTTTWSAPARVNDEWNSISWYPRPRIVGGDIIYVLWIDQRNNNPDVFLAEGVYPGAIWSANARISDDGGEAEQSSPDIALDTAGNVYAIWTDWRGDNPDIYFSYMSGGVKPEPPKPDPKGEEAPSTLPPKEKRETNPGWGGDEDEAFMWTHEHIDNLSKLQQAYRNSNSISRTIAATIPITRYYGETEPDHTLKDNVINNVIKEAKLFVCFWDIDRDENIGLTINEEHVLPLRMERDQGYDCQYQTLDPKWLKFPQKPGDPSDPTDPNSNPTSPTPENNTFTITYSPDYKALIYGMRLIIKAVRPVVLVPGFGGDANSYGWDEVERLLTDTYGVIVKRPCHYKWVDKVEIEFEPGLPPNIIINRGWYLGLYDREKDYENEPVTLPSSVPDNGPYDTSTYVHRRCFESARTQFEIVGQQLPDPLNVLPKDRNGIGTLDKNADALMWTITELKDRYGVAKVNLVGHSKGGLFSRAYVDMGEYRGDVDNLISISSPHQGIYIMDIAAGVEELPADWADRIQCKGIQLFCSRFFTPDTAKSVIRTVLQGFKPDDITGKEITTVGVADKFAGASPAPEVAYHSIVVTAGREDDPSRLDWHHGKMTIFPNPFGAFSVEYRMNYFLGDLTVGNPRHDFFQSIQGQSDIPITTASQKMDKLSGYEAYEYYCTGIRENHEYSSKVQPAANAVAKVLGLSYDGSGLVENCDDILREKPGTSTERPKTSARVPTSEYPEHALSFSGFITYGQTTDIPFAVDGSNLQTIALWDGDADVTLTLSDPSGAVITPTVAAGDDNIDYYEERETGAGFGDAIYAITDTLKGMWIAHVIAPGSGTATGPMRWDLIVPQRSPVSFTLSTIPLTTTFGNSVTLRAAAVTDTLPILGASMEGEIRSWNGITQSIVLVDDGLHDDLIANDGMYGNRFTPSQAGEYRASVMMSGTLPSGVPYMRQDETLFTILPVSAHFTGVYNDVGIDEDGDGLFDKLRLQVEVAVDRDGQYMLHSDLSTPDGTSLGSRSKLISETAGTTVTVNLDFDAALFVDRPADGPVTLSKVTLVDRSAGLRTDYREDTYTTESYSRLDFSGWQARLVSSLSDQGVDTNGNGKFDYLEVEIPIEVRRAGTYTATAVLELADGSRIRAPEVVSDTLPGVNAFSFQFNGPTIALHVADGPYTVTNMLVEGPMGMALFQDTVGETTAHSYLDFEIDSAAPVSSMNPLSSFTTTLAIELSWGATDPSPSAGIASYDIQYRVGPGGTWTDWLTNTVLTAYTFGPNDPVSVEIGQTYYFRIRANDFAGNQEPYPGRDGDTHIRIVESMPPCLLGGDFNGDGDVNVTDVQWVANRWRQAAGSPDDFDGDELITIKDIMWVVVHWGETCP